MIWDEAYRQTLLCPVSTCNKIIEAYEHCLYMEVR
jgi:hypothetical protein